MKHLLWLAVLLICSRAVLAQKPLPRPSQSSDTVRVVEIIRADRFNFRTVDSATQLQILTGNVQIRQGKTFFNCDSLVWNEATNFMEAHGNVHIRDADSINIYSRYLQYEGNRKTAIFRNNVRLSDGNSTLFTDDMEYDMNGKVGQYRNGGRIESKQTTLTSRQGYYYADIKDVYFIGDVKMSDPEVALASDSLLYNTGNQVATFIAPTTIRSGASIINTREGYYDLKLKKAKFGSRARMQDSTSVMIADDFAFDEASGLGEAAGNVQYRDTAQGLLLFSNRVFFKKVKKNFLATEKAVVVTVQEQDSVFIAADTIYSGLMNDLPALRYGYIRGFDTSTRGGPGTQAPADTIRKVPPAPTDDTAGIRLPPDPVTGKPRDSIAVALPDSNTLHKPIPRPGSDTLRFITAFRHVRIFSDSLQAVGDSLFYSGVDSVFELYYDPVAWSRSGQITGDTIFIRTENKKPKELWVAENALMIQEVSGENEFYNQLRGRTIAGAFNNGELESVEANGMAESVYFALDDDSAYVGMNRATADRINLYFGDRNIRKVKYTRSVKSILYPIRQLPEEKLKLDDFQWLEGRRPKSKLELFY